MGKKTGGIDEVKDPFSLGFYDLAHKDEFRRIWLPKLAAVKSEKRMEVIITSLLNQTAKLEKIMQSHGWVTE